jgi:hypothetical protein
MFREILAWALLVFLAASSMCFFRPKPLANDGYQYLSVAENFNHGRGLTTSLVFFDTERSQGRIPAQLTTFPPGYPVVVAMTSRLWGDLEGTARVVSCICYAGTAALLAWALILTGVTALWRQVVLLLFATNAFLISFATSVSTEPLYMLLSTGAVVALIWVEKSTLPKHVLIAAAVIAYSVAGLAYWVRYAGLFFIAAVLSYALLQLVLHRNRYRTVLLLTALIPVTLAGSMMLRNLATVGNWRGGNDMTVSHPLNDVMIDYAKAQLHLILGQHDVTFGVWESSLLVGGLGVVVLLIAAVRKGGGPNTSWPWMSVWRKPTVGLLVGLCVLVYSVGIFYAGLRTVISFGPRMFLPILPLYLLLLGMGLNWLTSRWPASAQSPWLKVGILLVIVGYAGINARDLHERLKPAPHEILAALYAKPTADGQTLLKWVESNTDVGDTLIAVDGQATGYLLHRSTVGMIKAQYSSVRWECDEIKTQMKRYKSSYVILYKPSSSTIYDAPDEWLLTESQFVATSVSQQPPCGFVIAAENSNVRILKIGGSERASQN